MFQLTRSLKFLMSEMRDYPVDQVSRPDYPATIFLLNSNFIKKLTRQFTLSPTIRVSAYPVAKISQGRLPGRPSFSSRLPGNDFPAQQ